MALNAHISRSDGDFDPGFIAHLLSGFEHDDDIFKVIINIGCTYAITPHKDDFIQHMPLDQQNTAFLSVMTMNGPTSVVEIGITRWVFLCKNGD